MWRVCFFTLSMMTVAMIGCDASRPADGGDAADGGGEAIEEALASDGGNGVGEDETMTEVPGPRTQLATFGGGCFWCVEAVMEQLDGVVDASSGYMGGHVDNPTYEQVCGKQTGHIEVVQVEFDPAKVSYGTLLKWFFKAHDPTSRDQQGGDKGPQYRSAIFCHSGEHKQAALDAIKKIDDSKAFDKKVVTEVLDAQKYWEAEGYHQDFYRLNKQRNGYCQVVISTKLDKLGLDK